MLLAGCGGGQSSSPQKLLATAEVNAQPVTPDRQDEAHGNPRGGEAFFPNEHGITEVYSSAGAIDMRNPFFKPFGNGRSCASCHAPSDGFSMTPEHLRERFARTAGTDPVFMPHDGANSPLAPVDTVNQRRAAYSMLLNKGVIRVGMKIPANAEFELVSADDPYHYASANELSLFRRPLPAMNLKFQSNVMWDGRETLFDFSPGNTNCLFGALCYASLDADLAHQASDALRDHAQAAADFTDAQRQAIVNFESSLYVAQSFDRRAKTLSAAGAKGGPMELVNTDFYLGINDLFFGNVRTGAPFNPNPIQVYGAWDKWDVRSADSWSTVYARQQIARGEKIFATKTFSMTNVGGINDDLHIPVVTNATCAACHNVPQVGTNSFPFPENIGVSDDIHRTLDMPLYTMRNKATGEILKTTDPGQAMITGMWKDIGRFKTPSLRGLASHAPYFHDGSAATLRDVVLFYNARFGIGYTEQEVEDLTAFLSAL